jgi:protein involved in polysaccharide export with SLBB domain
MRSFILFIALVFAGCHTQPVARTPFGQPGPGKIVIAIAGDVEQPGQYYVDGGTKVESLPALAGGLRVCSTCHMSPSVVYLIPRGHPEHKQWYSLSRTEELQDIRLIDGDMVNYATRHF